MNCVKCGRIIQNDAAFCPYCGKKQVIFPRKKSAKVRGNGMGTAYKRGNTWTACVTVGWLLPDDPSKPKVPVRKTKGGFKSKKEAINYCPKLLTQTEELNRMTMQETWNAWNEMYASRIVASTMGCYKYAYKHFSRLHGTYMDQITSDELQACMDACKAGKRTHQNMKCVAGLLWGYAFDHNAVRKDITDNLYIGKGESVQRDPVEAHEVEAIRDSIGKYRYAEYIYCLCFLGFRPGELLELKKDMLHCAMIPEEKDTEVPVWYFVNGKKTPAGKDRIVVVPDQILEIVLSRLFIPGTDLMFPMYQFSRKEGNPFTGFKQMSHDYLNKHVFKPIMESLGFSSAKVPYSCRHTYADMLKNASGSDKDKAALIGHSKYLFTQDRYQSTAINDLKMIVDSFSNNTTEKSKTT